MRVYWIKFDKTTMCFQSRITHSPEGHDHALTEGYVEVAEVYYVSLCKLILSHIEKNTGDECPF